MEIRFERTEAEIKAGAKHLYCTNLKFRKTVWRNTVLGVLAFLVMAFTLVIKSRGLLEYVLAALIGCLAGFQLIVAGWGPAIAARSTIRLARKQGYASRLVGPLCVRVVTTGLEFEGELGSSRMNWSAIESVGRDEHHIFIKISVDQVVAIPLTAFTDDAAADDFVSKIRELRLNAANFLERCPQCGYSFAGKQPHGCPECGWARPDVAAPPPD